MSPPPVGYPRDKVTNIQLKKNTWNFKLPQNSNSFARQPAAIVICNLEGVKNAKTKHLTKSTCSYKGNNKKLTFYNILALVWYIHITSILL